MHISLGNIGAAGFLRHRISSGRVSPGARASANVPKLASTAFPAQPVRISEALKQGRISIDAAE
jgi:hypothetical protein